LIWNIENPETEEISETVP